MPGNPTAVGTAYNAVQRWLVLGARASCRAWPNQQIVTVKGAHFLQEEAPDAVGDATARFVAKVLAGQIAQAV